jgi:hypothetical protein
MRADYRDLESAHGEPRDLSADRSQVASRLPAAYRRQERDKAIGRDTEWLVISRSSAGVLKIAVTRVDTNMCRALLLRRHGAESHSVSLECRHVCACLFHNRILRCC